MILILLKRILSDNCLTLLHHTYGYGGWLIEGDNTDAQWCKKQYCLGVFRFHPVINNYLYANNVYEVIPLGNTIAIDLTSPEVIWNNLIRQNRNKVRKAVKSGILEYTTVAIRKSLKNLKNL